MVGVDHIGEGVLWVTWGVVGILLSMLLGGFLIRREVTALAVAGSGSTAVAQPMTTRLTALILLNLLILLSVVWAMVAKPAESPDFRAQRPPMPLIHRAWRSPVAQVNITVVPPHI